MINENNEAVLFAVQEGVARITLNRPEKRNALNDAMIGGLKELLRRADQDESVRVIVIAGTGSDFCSGADLAALQKISTAAVSENLEDALSAGADVNTIARMSDDFQRGIERFLKRK